MKAASLPNLNRETTSFPNFFTLYHNHDTTLSRSPTIDQGEETEASETSPFKDIFSPFVSFNELNENHYPVGGSFYEWNQMDQTLPRRPPSPNESDTNVSVGSNQFSSNVGARSEGPPNPTEQYRRTNFTQLRRETEIVCNNERKKGAWSPEEDQKLRAYILRYGHWNWRELPKFAGLARSGKSCRLRWMNYLRPNVERGSYTKEEEDIIIKLHEELGNKWSAISAKLPGRTDNGIKNYWHTHLKKRLYQNQSTNNPGMINEQSIDGVQSVSN